MLDGHRAAERQDWATASDAFGRATSLAANDVMHWHWLAMASLAAGQREKYQWACDELLRRFSASENANDIHWVLRTWLVRPHDDKRLARLRPVVDTYARHFADSRSFTWLYELRAGNIPFELMDSTRSPATLGPHPDQWYILAMARYKAGDTTQASLAYEAGARQGRAGLFRWDIDLFRETLRAEVEALLTAEPPPTSDASPRTTTGLPSPSDSPSSGEIPASAQSAQPK
jgi:hypothetical protein